MMNPEYHIVYILQSIHKDLSVKPFKGFYM